MSESLEQNPSDDGLPQLKCPRYTMPHGIKKNVVGKLVLKKHRTEASTSLHPIPLPRGIFLSEWSHQDSIYVKPQGGYNRISNRETNGQFGLRKFHPRVSVWGHSSGMWWAHLGSGGSRNCPELFRIFVSSSQACHLQYCVSSGLRRKGGYRESNYMCTLAKSQGRAVLHNQEAWDVHKWDLL